MRVVILVKMKKAYKLLTSNDNLSHVRSDAFKRDWDAGNVIVIYKSFVPIAVLTFKRYKSSGYGRKGDLHLKQMAVHPAHRRQGLGKALIDNLVQHAYSCRAPSIVLGVRKSNTPARKLYEKMGFKIKRPITWKQKGKDLPGYIYELKLYIPIDEWI